MKKLTSPGIDDTTITTALSNNDKLIDTSYPHLMDNLKEITDAYTAYIGKNGDALQINPLQIPKALKDGLISNYKYPPKQLKFIETLRKSSSTICPMCGSLGTGTIDHYFPKEDYPEFSIFSLNLVPACRCNSKRRRYLRDAQQQIRVLHPYFDDCLTQRLLSCRFIQSPAFPQVELKLVQLENDRFVTCHIENVVKKSGIEDWLSGTWSSLAESPSRVIHTMPREEIPDENELCRCLNEALSRYDDDLGSCNNWQSVFIHGLIHSEGAMAWILEKHNSEYGNTKKLFL